MVAHAQPPGQHRDIQPIFIVSPPRSGSSMLFQALETARDVFTIGGESHNLIEGIPGLHPRGQNWESNRLAAKDAAPSVVDALHRGFAALLRDRDGRAPTGPAIMVEKTPKNSLRIPFLLAAFPEARFIYLYRDPRETMSSMIEAWESGRFRTYPLLPGWQGTPWSLLLVPGWRDLTGLGVAEIVAQQWARTTTILIEDLAALPSGRVTAIDYRELATDPQTALEALCARAGIVWDRMLNGHLPYSPTVVSAPQSEKWRKSQALIAGLLPTVAIADNQARAALENWRAAALTRYVEP